MPDISAVEIPKPLNWQDFQRSSVILFRCILRDEQLQEFGRDGQTQHGIDLFGLRDGDTSRPVGIQNADEAASNLLDGQVSADRDSVALRTYLSASVGAHLFARAKKVFDALPPDLLKLPAYQRMAATYHWNTGDAKAAEPFIKLWREASPERLDLLLWHIDALIRLNAEDKVRRILTAELKSRPMARYPQSVAWLPR